MDDILTKDYVDSLLSSVEQKTEPKTEQTQDKKVSKIDISKFLQSEQDSNDKTAQKKQEVISGIKHWLKTRKFKKTILKSDTIIIETEPVVLNSVRSRSESQVVLKKQGDSVIGFDYHCKCGKHDSFIIE